MALETMRTASFARGCWDFVFGFRFLSTMKTVFQFFSAQCILWFFWYGKKVTSHSCAKTVKLSVIPRDHLELEECMTSLVSLTAVI